MKKEIQQHTRYLKGSGIRIEEDFPHRVVEERKKLKPHLKEAKKTDLTHTSSTTN